MQHGCPIYVSKSVSASVSVWVWQSKFVSAVTRLEQAEAKLSKKRWMDAEACLQDMSLRPTINTGIMGTTAAHFHRIKYLTISMAPLLILACGCACVCMCCRSA